MAKKRLKKGEKFSFVKFKEVQNESLMEKSLQGIWIGDYKLRVYLANKDGKSTDTRSERKKPGDKKVTEEGQRSGKVSFSYAEAVKYGKCEDSSPSQ